MDLTGLPIPADLRLVEREAHARDLWPRRLLGLTQAELPPAPAAVAFPRSTDEVVAALAWATERGVPVVPWGAGSGVCGAAEGRADALVLDLKRLRGVSAVDPSTGLVQVGAGELGQRFEDALEAQGWATRHSPSSIWCSTVGGWAASRSAGQFSSRYGKFEDMVAGLTVATPGGAFRAGDSAAADDLGPWVMGAEGALGIITELSVRVVPFPHGRWLRGYRFATTEAATEAMRLVMAAELFPAALRLYDPVDTRLAGKGTATREGGPGWLGAVRARIEAVPGLRRHLLELPLALPRLVNGLVRGIASGCVLIAGWEGEGFEEDARAGHAILLAAGGEDLGAEPGEHWYAHRHEVSYKLAPIFEMGGFADTMEVAALWSRLPELYRGVREALSRHAVVMAHFSHAYLEGCSIYFTFAGTGDVAVYEAAWRDALAAAAAAGGTVAHHHGVGQLKMAAAGAELAGVAPMFRALKRRLDPAGILNPGRMFPEQRAREPEPERPAVTLDAIARVATLDAQEPADRRDAWLAARGHRLRFPTPGPLSGALRGPRRPTESRVLGASALLDGRRIVLLPVPRSAAGPDPRASLPADAYETVTVPVVPT